MGNHKASQNVTFVATHNLEVPGSSPGWSTSTKSHSFIMMRKTCFTKYAVALLLALSATSCTKEQDFKELATEQFSANFKALVMGNKTIDAYQDWSTVATIPVEVSVSFDNADDYSVYIYQTPPTLNKDAAYIGMAKLRSGESKTIPVIKPAKVGLLYASCVDKGGHAMCKPFVAMADGCAVSFEGRMSPSSTIGTGNAWSVPRTSRPDITRYTSDLVEMTDAENETGREDSSEKHLLIGNKFDGLINRLNTFSNQSVYVVGTWNLTFDQRVTNGNIIIVGNGGRIVVPRGFKLTTKSTNADVADGRIYVMEGGYITGEGELEISSGTESNNYSNGNIFVKTLTLNGGALYNYGSLGDGSSTVTELVGKEDAKGNPSGRNGCMPLLQGIQPCPIFLKELLKLCSRSGKADIAFSPPEQRNIQLRFQSRNLTADHRLCHIQHISSFRETKQPRYF